MQLKVYCKALHDCLPWRKFLHSKTWLIMKLTVVLVMIACLQVQAKVHAQISVSARNAPLETVLKQIKKQSGLHLVYREEWMDEARKVSVQLKDVSVEDALDACFKNQVLTYELVGKTIVVKKPDSIIPSLAVAPTTTEQKDIIINGKVVDETGAPLANVSIVLKGSTKGVSSAADGSFSISVPNEKSVLVFSYVGKEIKEVIAAQARTLQVVLNPLVNAMEDVVVVAYGSQKKITVTGAVSTVNTEQLKQSSSASLANALAGRLSGLTSIQSGGGQPGRDDATLYLRGAATVNGNSPLILIDGVPRDNIRTIDPSEVASVSVLKDASATAVFGVRGANGVILITTKRGTVGKTQLTASIDQSYSSFTREPERLHSVEYLKLRNEAAKNDGIAIPYSDDLIAKYANPLEGLDPNAPDYAEQAAFRNYIYPDHDWYRELIKSNTPQTRINIGVTGGTSKLSYFVNGSYLHQGGNLNTEPKSKLGYDPSSWMDRYNFRANLDYKIAPTFKMFLNIGSYIERVNMPSAGTYPGHDTHWMMTDLIYQTQTILPITPGPTTLPGFGVPGDAVVYPTYLDRTAFEIMNRQGFRNEMRANLNSSLGAEWDLSKLVVHGLSIKGMISYDSKSTSAMDGYKNERLYAANVDPATNSLTYAVQRNAESFLNISKGYDSRYNVNLQASINYQNSFGKHTVGAFVLGQRDYWESTSGEIPYNVIGLSGRVTYDYDKRYLAEINLGYNGSEQFAPSNRYGFFPAASVGWVISNEKFFEPISHTISNLKLRASYGKVGNDQFRNPDGSIARFLYLDNITVGTGPLGSLGTTPSGTGQGIDQGLLGNPNLSWEVAAKQNYGVEVGLFTDLNVSFDYFVEKRTDILISRGTVPALQGVPLGNIPKVNMGIVDNKGYEIEVSYNKRLSKNFSFMIKGNLGTNHNVVKFYDEPISDETYAYRYRTTGFSLGQSWGYKIDYSNGNGYFNSKQELDGYLSKTTYAFGTPRVGDFIYQDLNGDGVVDDKDLAPIKYTSIPGRIYGLLLGFTWKQFDFSSFFQGVSRYSSNYANQGVYENIKLGTYYSYHETAWTPERYAAGEKITYPALSTVTTTNHRANDFFIMDRSFIRLKNIELAYNFPSSLLKSIRVQGVRAYISAYNFFTWDKLRMDHLDPENNGSLDYPVTKSLNCGVNITF
ncbi:MAG: TonB-dependent receptor [Agriterribacter sp.]